MIFLHILGEKNNMKVLHIVLIGRYTDNLSYQENYLTKYHKLLGHEVKIIASLAVYDDSGKTAWLPKPIKYVNDDGVFVTRLKLKKSKISAQLRMYDGLEEEINEFQPEVIFVHGVQFADILVIANYCKRHPEVKVYVDNHADFVNSGKNWISKNIQHRIIWRYCAQKINPYVTKFYGVLPARVDFLINEYKLPAEKVELLVMGADDEKVEAALNPEIRNEMRKKYDISDDEYVIMTGGKIDSNKPQTILLMEAVNNLDISNIKLIVFGAVSQELKEKFNNQLSDRVKFVGWKKSEDIYNEYATADIIAFPGLHSVLWEQAVAMGKPCIFRKIAGFSHIDLGGNCTYFENDTVESYCDVIKETIFNIEQLKSVAQQKGLDFFSYKKIAEKALEE